MHLLRNRFYLGEVVFKGEVLAGEQPAIVDRDLFEAVQAKLDAQRTHKAAHRASPKGLFVGRIFDSRGNRMTPSHRRPRGIEYRYYISAALLQGRADEASAVTRVPAAEVEAVVAAAMREHYAVREAPADDQSLIAAVTRVEVRPDGLAITLRAERFGEAPDGASPEGDASGDGAGEGPFPNHPLSVTESLDHDHPDSGRSDQPTIWVPWRKPSSRRRRDIEVPTGVARSAARPIRIETRATLETAIARGRRWLAAMVAGDVETVDEIAALEGCSVRLVNMTISLAFLAPDLVKAAVEGRLPRGIGVTRLPGKQPTTLGCSATNASTWSSPIRPTTCRSMGMSAASV